MISREKTGAIVVGAGVVGLACARALALRNIETIVIEQHNGIGQETSSRNSEVIHAGLYYPSNSKKAALCTAGKEELYRFCELHKVPFRRCGKIIVATHESHEEKLEALLAQAHTNGVTDIEQLTAKQARDLEPALQCTSALLSPSTGIIDSHAFMLALLGEAESHGATLALNSRVVNGRIDSEGIELLIRCGEEELLLGAEIVINSAGLSAPAIASTLQGFPAAHVPRAYFAKGNYYALSGRAPFSRLIYPIPEAGGLGVHLTLDLGGQARFGPDVEWVQTPDYSVSPSRSSAFYAEVRKYWPDLADNALMPGYCGIRPKISGPKEPAADFVIDGPAVHNVGGLVNLFGIESPGLTASLAIANHACSLLGLSNTNRAN